MISMRTLVSLLKSNKEVLGLKEEQKKSILENERVMKGIVKKIWEMLEKKMAMAHYQVAELFIEICSINHKIVMQVVSEMMNSPLLTEREETHQKFSLLWRLTGELGHGFKTFSKTIFLMLDSLNSEYPSLKLEGKSWLAESITKIDRILDPILEELLETSLFSSLTSSFISPYDTKRIRYLFKILISIIDCDFKLFMKYVNEQPPSKFILSFLAPNPNSDNFGSFDEIIPPNQPLSSNQEEQSDSSSNNDKNLILLNFPKRNYLDLLVIGSLRFLEGETKEKNGDFFDEHSVVQTDSTEFLQYLITNITDSLRAADLAKQMQEIILQNLAKAVSSQNLVLQVHLLKLLRSIIIIDSQQHQPMGDQSEPVFLPSLYASSSNYKQIFSQKELKKPTAKTHYESSIASSQMFLQTLIIGLLQTPSQNIRFYWLDFITCSLPLFYFQVYSILEPIIKCMSEIILSYQNIYDSISAKDIIVLLKALSLIVNTSLDIANKKESNTSEEKKVWGLGNLFTFTSSSDIFQESQYDYSHKTKNALLSSLTHILKSMLKLWGDPKNQNSNIISQVNQRKQSISVLSLNKPKPPKKVLNNFTTSLALVSDLFSNSDEIHNKYAIQDHIIQVLDPLITSFPQPFLSCLLQFWKPNLFYQKYSKESSNKCNVGSRKHKKYSQKIEKKWIEILNNLNVEHLTLFQALYEISSSLISPTQTSKNKEVASNQAKEMVTLDFIYHYINANNDSNQTKGNFFQCWPVLNEILKSFSSSKNPYSHIFLLSLIDCFVNKAPFSKLTSQQKIELRTCVNKVVDSLTYISTASFFDLEEAYNFKESILSHIRTSPSLHISSSFQRFTSFLNSSSDGYSHFQSRKSSSSSPLNHQKQQKNHPSTKTEQSQENKNQQKEISNNKENKGNESYLENEIEEDFPIKNEEEQNKQEKQEEQGEQEEQEEQEEQGEEQGEEQRVDRKENVLVEQNVLKGMHGLIGMEDQVIGRDYLTTSMVLSVFNEEVDNKKEIPVQEKKEIPQKEDDLPPPPLEKKKNVLGKKEESMLIETLSVINSLKVLSNVLPSLLDIIYDDEKEKEKSSGIISNLIYYIYPAYLKRKPSNSLHYVIEQTVGGMEEHRFISTVLLCNITCYSYTQKIWKKYLGEFFFNENDFFKMEPKSISIWKRSINTFLLSSPTVFTDLLKQVKKSLATQMFASKDQENLSRAVNLKRLAFIILCGKINQYETKLAAIIEKIVEFLKVSRSPVVYKSVFLLLSVIVIRFSSQKLDSLWPLVLTELIKIFTNPKKEVQIIFSCVKFLDLAITFGIEKFNIHEWMFFSNAFQSDSSPYSEDNPTSTFSPFLQQLVPQEMKKEEETEQLNVQQKSKQKQKRSKEESNENKNLSQKQRLNRPFVTISNISGVEHLKNLLNSFTQHMYMNEHAGGLPDLDFIERLVELDFVEMDLNPLITQQYLYTGDYLLDENENLKNSLHHPQFKEYFNFLYSFPLIDSNLISIKRGSSEIDFDIFKI